MTNEEAKEFICKKFISIRLFCKASGLSYDTVRGRKQYAKYLDKAMIVNPIVFRINPELINIVKFALRRKGFLLKDLSEQTGFSQQTTRNVLCGKRTTDKFKFTLSVLENEFNIYLKDDQIYAKPIEPTKQKTYSESLPEVQRPSEGNDRDVQENPDEQHSKQESTGITGIIQSND